MNFRHVENLHLTTLGKCTDCGEYVQMNYDLGCMPEHYDENGNICRGSGYSSVSSKYRVDTPKQAKALANFILQDKGNCLKGSVLHSKACADGLACETERLNLARALAEYVLKGKI